MTSTPIAPVEQTLVYKSTPEREISLLFFPPTARTNAPAPSYADIVHRVAAFFKKIDSEAAYGGTPG